MSFWRTAAAFIALIGSSVADPPIPTWGGAPAWSATINFTDVSDAPEHPNWFFNYSYDWSLKASRYDHGDGQHDEVCKFGGLPLGPRCTVINSADGHMYLLAPADSCCVCKSKWAPFTILPDWLQRSNASYLGASVVDGVSAGGWLAYGASDNHYWATADAAQSPVRFMEHKNNKLKQWDFLQYARRGHAPTIPSDS